MHLHGPRWAMPEPADTVDPAYLERILAKHSELGPKPERVSESYADERIREKIARMTEERQQAGLWSISKTLKEHDVPPEVRLHLVTAVVNLGRIADQTREARTARATNEDAAGAGPGA